MHLKDLPQVCSLNAHLDHLDAALASVTASPLMAEYSTTCELREPPMSVDVKRITREELLAVLGERRARFVDSLAKLGVSVDSAEPA